MADILLSPGVATREFDKSQLTKQPIQYGGAIIGPTVKGIKNIQTRKKQHYRSLIR